MWHDDKKGEMDRDAERTRFDRDSFSARLDHGRAWEKALADWLRRQHGYLVIPVGDIESGTGRGPRALAPLGAEDIVLPDLLVFKAGRELWVEVKWKTRATLNEQRGYTCTGIDLAKYEEYRRIAAATGRDIVLVFVHQEEREVRADLLSRLTAYESHRYVAAASRVRTNGYGDMVYWRYDRLPLTALLTTWTGQALSQGERKHLEQRIVGLEHEHRARAAERSLRAAGIVASRDAKPSTSRTEQLDLFGNKRR